MNLKQYLKSQIGRNDPVGDLARDLKNDKGCKAKTYDELHSHLLVKNACSGAIDALKEAARECGQVIPPNEEEDEDLD